MAPGGFFIASRRGGPGFLQLAIRAIRGDTYTVEFGLPEIDWSSASFDQVRTALEDDGFAPTVEVGKEPVTRFMRVMVEGSESQVTERVTALFVVTARCLKWDPNSTFNVRFGGPMDLSRARTNLELLKRRSA